MSAIKQQIVSKAMTTGDILDSSEDMRLFANLSNCIKNNNGNV